MALQLSNVEARVLGALVEKESTTPEYYPLSLNALVNACNQKSNRDPVMTLEEEAVRPALRSLSDQAMVRSAGGDSRVAKFEHRLNELYNFHRHEIAVLCVLLLRGPQTPGELRTRAERMYAFEDLEAVHSALHASLFRRNRARGTCSNGAPRRHTEFSQNFARGRPCRATRGRDHGIKKGIEHPSRTIRHIPEAVSIARLRFWFFVSFRLVGVPGPIQGRSFT
jgi:uncharacterized protein YceH (UPF0502 family)